MKKSMRKTLFLAAVCLLLPVYVHASSYNFTFDFKVSLVSQIRSMSGSHVSITTTSKPSKTSVDITTFQVALERVTTNFLGIKSYSLIGKVSHPRTGTKTTKWTNVGSGNYQFTLSKANDGVTLTGTGQIFN